MAVSASPFGSAPRPIPIWGRLVAVPLVVAVLLLGLWVLGGKVADDVKIAMGLTALWFAAVGIGAFLVGRRYRPLALPVFGTFVVALTLVGGYLAYATFSDKVVNEQVVAASAASGNVQLSSGSFTGAAHPTSGTAAVVELKSGERMLTLTQFETDPGPDLRVYLAPEDGADVGDDVDLGGLKGNKGNQQYGIPDEVDLEKYTAVVIWCRAFSVSFGRAVLAGAA
jgi:hypothetical protein